MPNFLESFDWGDWAAGLIAGFVGGGASAVVGSLAISFQDPKDFSIGTTKFLSVAGTIFLVSGILNAAMYLKQNPIPKVKTVVTVETVKQESPTTVVRKTVEETRVDPKPDNVK